MCFGKSSKKRQLTPEEIKERDKNRGGLEDDTVTILSKGSSRSKGRSKSNVTGGTKNAPSRSRSPVGRGTQSLSLLNVMSNHIKSKRT